MANLKDLPELAERYIRRQENFYNRKLRDFNRFLIRDFAESLLKDLDGTQLPGESKVDLIQDFNKPLTSQKTTVAFISEESSHLTGGRYYAWFIAMALVEYGYEVTFYTNRKPDYYDNFKMYKQPNLEIVKHKSDLEILDVQADIYIGSPISGNIAVCTLANKYRKPSYTLMFDPSPEMKKYIGTAYGGVEKLVNLIRSSNVHIISLCQAMTDPMYDWLGKGKEFVTPIHPCINSKVMESVQKGKREDYVLFISRIVKHKKFDHVIQAVRDTGIKLKVISSNDGMGYQSKIKRMGLSDQIEFHIGVSDEEKFKMLYSARAVINAAVFEGFGMWAAEAIATGTPLVCYDYPTLKEIAKTANAKNVYFAKWNDPEDLTKKLDKALKENKFNDGNPAFNFETLVNRVGQVFSTQPRIGVITIALNEDKFINASLKSVITHPNVKKVAVVEGAVNLFSHASTSEGLSVDSTFSQVSDAINSIGGNKILYERYGWAVNKSELRNRALKLLGDDIDYVLVVDADEVWKHEDLDRLVEAMKKNPRTGVFLFNFYHFWKNKNLIATGGQWNAQMFRCFKYENKRLHWRHHAAPVVDENGKFINITNGSLVLDNVHVYHYGYMKDKNRVQEKLEFYKKRDKNLDVKDTWSDWKPGKPTQPTHGGGTVQKFEGEHPKEVKGAI